MELATIILSIIALAVSIVFGIITSIYWMRQNKIQGKLLEIEKNRNAREEALSEVQARLLNIEEQRQAHIEVEQKKAKIIISYQEGRGTTPAKILLANNGNSAAMNVEVLFDGMAFQKHPYSVTKKYPSELNPGDSAEIKFKMTKNIGQHSDHEITVVYDDESGTKLSVSKQI